MTQLILLGLIAVNCVLVIFNWRTAKRLQHAEGLYTQERDSLYVRGFNVSDQFIGKGVPVVQAHRRAMNEIQDGVALTSMRHPGPSP